MGLSRPICLRITSISSLPALGPEAKNTAGSPGSTRISRNVKTSTPNSAGSEDRKRCPARIKVAPIVVICLLTPPASRPAPSPHPEELAPASVSKDEARNGEPGLMVRDGADAPPHHEDN